MKYYQFTCAASPGNSGGPLVNEKAEVLGVVSWQVRDGQNLNFAIPAPYAMALDHTLPTQPWDKVVSEPQSSLFSETITEAKCDRLLADGYTVAWDAGATSVEVAVLLRAPVRKHNLPTVPPNLYEASERLPTMMTKLSSFTVSGAREQVRRWLIEDLAALQKVLAAQQQAILLIQRDEGWLPEASNLWARATALARLRPAAPETDLREVQRSSAYRDALPEMLRDLVAPCGFQVGVYLFSGNLSYLIDVRVGEFGYTLGLRAGDVLVSGGGREPLTYGGLKQAIEENLGKLMSIVVERRGRLERVVMRIPSEIPLSARNKNGCFFYQITHLPILQMF